MLSPHFPHQCTLISVAACDAIVGHLQRTGTKKPYLRLKEKFKELSDALASWPPVQPGPALPHPDLPETAQEEAPAPRKKKPAAKGVHGASLQCCL